MKNKNYIVMSLSTLVLAFSFNVYAKGGVGGVGAFYGKSNNATEGGLVLKAAVHGKSPGDSLVENPNGYGYSEMRLEIGTGFGIAGNWMSGTKLSGLKRGETGVAPLLGLEIFNVRLSANTDDDREDFIEWMPMMAAGLNAATNGCALSLVARGGAALGTLGDGGVRSAAGVGTYLNCKKVDLSADFTRIWTKGQPVDLARAELVFPALGDNMYVGISAEAISTRQSKSVDLLNWLPETNDKVEKRAFLVVGGTY